MATKPVFSAAPACRQACSLRPHRTAVPFEGLLLQHHLHSLASLTKHYTSHPVVSLRGCDGVLTPITVCSNTLYFLCCVILRHLFADQSGSMLPYEQASLHCSLSYLTLRDVLYRPPTSLFRMFHSGFNHPRTLINGTSKAHNPLSPPCHIQ